MNCNRELNNNKTNNCEKCIYYRQNDFSIEDDIFFIYSKCLKYDDEWYDAYELNYIETVEVEEEGKDSYLINKIINDVAVVGI